MEILTTYKTELLSISQEIFRVISVFSISLAIVYLIGRMLELIKSARSKNLIAFFAILTINTFYSYNFLSFNSISLLIWDIALYSSYCILLYDLLGFKLYDRLDDLLDKKIGKDKPFRKN